MKFIKSRFKVDRGFLDYEGYVIGRVKSEKQANHIMNTLIVHFEVERFMELDASATPLQYILEAKGKDPKSIPLPPPPLTYNDKLTIKRELRAKQLSKAIKEVDKLGEKADNKSQLQVFYGVGYDALTEDKQERTITYRDCAVCDVRFSTYNKRICDKKSCKKEYAKTANSRGKINSRVLAKEETKKNRAFIDKYGSVSHSHITSEEKNDCKSLAKVLGLSPNDFLCEFGDIE